MRETVNLSEKSFPRSYTWIDGHFVAAKENLLFSLSLVMTAPSRQLAPVCIRGIYLFAPLAGRLTWTATRAPYYSYNVKPFGARAALRPANMPTTLVCCCEHWAAPPIPARWLSVTVYTLAYDAERLKGGQKSISESSHSTELSVGLSLVAAWWPRKKVILLCAGTGLNWTDGEAFCYSADAVRKNDTATNTKTLWKCVMVIVPKSSGAIIIAVAAPAACV